MTEPAPTPILVPKSAAPSVTLAALRPLFAAVGGVFVTQGILSEAELDAIIGLILIVGPTLWSMARARRNVARETTLERHVDDSIARIG